MNPVAKEQKPYYDRKGKHYYGWFYDDVYGFTTHLIWPVSNKQRQAWFKETYGIDDTEDWDANATCYELRHASGKGHAHLIAMSRWEPSPKCIAMLTHECFSLGQSGVRPTKSAS